jgi:hypothetical protein
VALREGTDCPQSCRFLRNGKCGAVNFQGLRFIPDRAFFAWAEYQIRVLLRDHPAGIVVRLHVAGDFPDDAYIAFWARMLRENPGLHVWGHFHHRGSLRKLIEQRLNLAFPDQSCLRASEVDTGDLRAVTARSQADLKGTDAVACPADLKHWVADASAPGGFRSKRRSTCDRCGLCMNADIKTIAWLLKINGLSSAPAKPGESNAVSAA